MATRASRPRPKPTQRKAPVELLAGGNPRIAKGEGAAPVRAYIDALPGWKRAVGRRLDALVTRAVPGVQKAVKWSSPFYGVPGRGFFLAVHAYTHFLKLSFFRGAALRPMPPGASKSPEVRYLDLREGTLDEAQLTSWVKQAAALPGWDPGAENERRAARPKAATRASKRPKAPTIADGEASRRITDHIAALDDWRGERLAELRTRILAAAPGIVEEWKWGIPVWSKDGILCTGEVYKTHVKTTFAKGAALPDPARLFNASLEGNARRAIDLAEGDRLDGRAFEALVRAAAALNASGKKPVERAGGGRRPRSAVRGKVS